MKTLNLFYEEPQSDRWLLFDRYPRKLMRRILRGKRRPGGQERVFLNLCAGLNRLGVLYRVNDYRYLQRRPDELACIIGKPNVLDKIAWRNRILFGAAVHSHPSTDPELLKRLPVRKVLVPGEWMRKMCEPYYGKAVAAWPVGIDTQYWNIDCETEKVVDFLLYDKVRWEHEHYERVLLEPIRQELRRHKLSYVEIRYGFYEENAYRDLLRKCRAMIFVCEHETQGIAYQQALACGAPILAWDRGGFWQDPAFYPDRVKFEPVTSVPYWDQRCGEKFVDAASFPERLEQFWDSRNQYSPRDYVVQNLTLEICAQKYVQHACGVNGT